MSFSPTNLLFLCDHASNAVPPELKTLGLPEDAFTTHIAYDIGAGELTAELARRFDATAILGPWSRLVVDLNRGGDDPTVVMRLSDGRIIPENRDITRAEIDLRIGRYHTPYHAKIEKSIADVRARGQIPTLISIHSFTPVWRGKTRPWHFGILWDRDDRLALPLIEHLRRNGRFNVGDNEPYTGTLENDSMYRHGTMNGLPHALIEVRQDLIADEKGVSKIANALEAALRETLDAMGPATIRFTRPLNDPVRLAEHRHPEGVSSMDEKTRTEIEAAVFRRLVAHLRTRSDVQNIDMMNLSGFCRNCLGDWYREAAGEKGLTLEKDDARELIYGMPPSKWKELYQKEASSEALAQFAKSAKTHS
jgi:predicted N-formylglutamate amidohydrolase